MRADAVTSPASTTTSAASVVSTQMVAEVSSTNRSRGPSRSGPSGSSLTANTYRVTSWPPPTSSSTCPTGRRGRPGSRSTTTAPEAWLRIAKKGSGLASVSIGEALDGALCFGWIDGQRRGLDEVSFLQRYCPRRARSSWSQVNVEKVARLTAEGRMRPAGPGRGRRRAGGRSLGRGVRAAATATVPDDLAAALAADPVAAAAFEALGRSERYAVMLPVLKATSPSGPAPGGSSRAVGRLSGR